MKNHPVSVALTDINMPGKSGIELLSEVIAGYPDIAVIMISAVANSDTAIACMRQGAYDYILKPFNSHEVVLRIEHALEKENSRLIIGRINCILNKKWKTKQENYVLQK